MLMHNTAYVPFEVLKYENTRTYVCSDFQCIVVVRQSEIDNIPPPFLNRFEKYSLTHKSLLEAVMNTLPAYLRAVVQRAQEKVCSHAVSTYTIYISKLSARCFVVLTQQ